MVRFCSFLHRTPLLFGLLISGLFIVGLGFLQQIAANPLAINMGDPSKGNMRLSLAGGINNVGTTIGLVIVAFAIFGGLPDSAADMNSSLQCRYLIWCWVLPSSLLLCSFVFLQYLII